MYRFFTKEEIIKHTTIYKCERDLVLQDLPNIKEFFDNPSLSLLLNILTSSNIDKNSKSAILMSLNTTLNYTSVKDILKNRSNLLYLLDNVDIKPIYSYEQVKAITSYNVHKSTNTNIITNMQVMDVENKLNQLGYQYKISINGFTDFDWEDRKSSVKADGIIYKGNEEIVLFLRYGSSSGGSQNDRYRGMFDIARANPNKKFIFVCDGPEAFLQYQLALDNLPDGACKNGLWVTAKLLKFIDLEGFKILTT